jgi:predicted ATP-dependent endonuclease of OLD family
MLRRLCFTNFKSWPKADLACGAITGLFGTNSSGKTSILQFLLLLKQTKEATNRLLSLELNGDYVELGTIRDAIHRHDETLPIDMEITFGRGSPLVLSDPATRGATRQRRRVYSDHPPLHPAASRTNNATNL